MRRFRLLLLLLPTVAWPASQSFNFNSGVVVLHPLISEKEAVCIPEIAGQWDAFQVKAGNSCEYEVVTDDETYLRFRLMRLGGQLFADTTLTNLPEGLSIAWHVPLRVRLNGGQLKVGGLSTDWLGKELEHHPLPNRRLGGLFLLTASTAQLQDLFTRTADAGDIFTDVTFTRTRDVKLTCGEDSLSPMKGERLRITVPACAAGQWTQWVNRPGKATWNTEAESELIIEYKLADGSLKDSLEGPGTDCVIKGDVRSMRFRPVAGKEAIVTLNFGPGDIEKPDQAEGNACSLVDAK